MVESVWYTSECFMMLTWPGRAPGGYVTVVDSVWWRTRVPCEAHLAGGANHREGRNVLTRAACEIE